MASVDIDFEDESLEAPEEEPVTGSAENEAGSEGGCSSDAADGADAGAGCDGTEAGADGDSGDAGSTAGDDGAAEDKGSSEGSGIGSDDSAKGQEASSAGHRPDRKDQQIAELNDRYLRLFAEFDNFRKRSEIEKAGRFADGERNVLLKVLPLIDNFERALATVPEDQRESAFVTGMDKVYRAFTDQLKELGVTAIEAVGHEFDANFHNAVMHVDDDSQPDNTVVEEFQKGYMFKDRVLRYSMVKVAN